MKFLTRLAILTLLALPAIAADLPSVDLATADDTVSAATEADTATGPDTRTLEDLPFGEVVFVADRGGCSQACRDNCKATRDACVAACPPFNFACRVACDCDMYYCHEACGCQQDPPPSLCT